MSFLLVSTYFSFATFTNCTQKVPLFDLESPKRYCADFYPCGSSNFCCPHEFVRQGIWMPIHEPEVI